VRLTCILWGPPGTRGKEEPLQISSSNETIKRLSSTTSAISAWVKRTSETWIGKGQIPDGRCAFNSMSIHRFNSVLRQELHSYMGTLCRVKQELIALIGATYSEKILLSYGTIWRHWLFHTMSRFFTLNPLGKSDLECDWFRQALTQDLGLEKSLTVELKETVIMRARCLRHILVIMGIESKLLDLLEILWWDQWKTRQGHHGWKRWWEIAQHKQFKHFMTTSALRGIAQSYYDI